ncbi:uncharacterized protein LOC121500211 [Vulpes lagopus]|uniref:uncharacterized protein LOC121500211 n=1 Tax=Vulpes lagopus TaxID=494514 RepID=UPI001BC9BBF8|nr:uncharacterized protein LOC121500211 [Vulpes lagopus]
MLADVMQQLHGPPQRPLSRANKAAACPRLSRVCVRPPAPPLQPTPRAGALGMGAGPGRAGAGRAGSGADWSRLAPPRRLRRPADLSSRWCGARGGRQPAA